jgi:hypothetical protein
MLKEFRNTRTHCQQKEEVFIPLIILYMKSFGCAGSNALATVNTCVIFKVFNSFLLFAAPIEPKKRP